MLWNCCLWGANMGNLIVKVHMKSAQKIFEYEKLIQFWKKKEIYRLTDLQNYFAFSEESEKDQWSGIKTKANWGQF